MKMFVVRDPQQRTGCKKRAPKGSLMNLQMFAFSLIHERGELFKL